VQQPCSKVSVVLTFNGGFIIAPVLIPHRSF
jgi:hypothetical protein